MNPPQPPSTRAPNGVSLVEVAMVLVISGIMVGLIIWLGGLMVKEQEQATSEQKLDTLTMALTRYATLNGRLPCPADPALATSDTAFGAEAANAGSCTGGVPTATSAGGDAVMGWVPFVALGLQPSDGLDAWDQRIMYYVDRRITADQAFATFPAADATIGAIEVRDDSGTARTTQALYALVSLGANGHGATSATGTLIHATTPNAQEQENNHRDATGATTTLNAILIQREATPTFDDIVRFQLRSALKQGRFSRPD